MTRQFTPTPAKRETVPLLVGITGESGGGKTFSALRLATGIQAVTGRDIYVLDTENRRALHYADKFKFIHVPFAPPFGSLDYLEAIKFCASQNPAVTIVDSMTHEHVGSGGYLETAEDVVTRIAGTDYKKREKAAFAGWAKAGPLRTKMIEGVKQLGGNFIFCWRAKEKVKPVAGGSPIEMGLMPIGGEEWVYEMAINFMLRARADGVPTWREDHVGERLMMKLPEQFKPLFPPDTRLDESAGRRMAEWARGGAASSATGAEGTASPGSSPGSSVAGDDAASRGTDALRGWFRSVPTPKRPKGAELDRLRQIAADADAMADPVHEPETEDVI